MTKLAITPSDNALNTLEVESDENEESDNLSEYICEQINEMKDQKQQEKGFWRQLKKPNTNDPASLTETIPQSQAPKLQSIQTEQNVKLDKLDQL
jgi:hypothetical protein